MPWTVADVDEHHRGLNAAQKRMWVVVANAAQERYKEEGGRKCDALAIRRANGAVEESMSKQPEEQEPIEVAELEITGEPIELVEKAVDPSGAISLKLIRPGWGSSGYYSPEVLERDGPKIFTKGTKMYWDHQTEAEERERPEGSLHTFAAALDTDAAWREDGAEGPGLYADATVFSDWTQRVDEMAPYIGTSIRAWGKSEHGEAEGKKGPIITALTSAKSVDFVTVPGAGGKVLQLFESYRNEKPRADESPIEEEPTMTEKEAQELRDQNEALVAENATLTEDKQRLQEALLLNATASLVTAELAAIEMAPLTRERLTESLQGKPVITDGELDVEATRQVITEAAQAEIDYLAGVVGSGEIRGMGEPPQTQKPGAFRESLKAMYIKNGKSLEEADRLAEIAALGR